MARPEEGLTPVFVSFKDAAKKANRYSLSLFLLRAKELLNIYGGLVTATFWTTLKSGWIAEKVKAGEFGTVVNVVSPVLVMWIGILVFQLLLRVALCSYLGKRSRKAEGVTPIEEPFRFRFLFYALILGNGAAAAKGGALVWSVLWRLLIVLILEFVRIRQLTRKQRRAAKKKKGGEGGSGGGPRRVVTDIDDL